MDLSPAESRRTVLASRLLFVAAAGACVVGGIIVALAMGWLP